VSGGPAVTERSLRWKVLVYLGALVTAPCAPRHLGPGPPVEPVLRVETGRHAAYIESIGADAAGRFLATASRDKTLRVWDLATGGLLRTIRPPIARGGREGELYAAAISPDGEVIATGGATGYEWDRDESIYLFARSTGRLLRRISGLPDIVKGLAFSADGRRLAATTGMQGVRLYRVADGKELGRDPYGWDSYGVDFDKSGRLATTAYDGCVRLYDPDLKLIAKVETRGENPFGIRFSPDGRLVAVGFYDATGIEVRSADDLADRYLPDVSGLDNGDLAVVAWSADGRTLYAGGLFQRNDLNPILRWADAGKGARTELTTGASDLIGSLQPLPRGRIAFGAGDASWGVLTASGGRERLIGPATADLREMGAEFRVDATGDAVKFSYRRGAEPATFQVKQRALLAGPADDRMSSPRHEAPGLVIKDWDFGTAPSLNGTRLKLRPYEQSRSLAISPDGRFFVLGTVHELYCMDPSGRERWTIFTPGATWAVNVSGDARIAVAAFGDGTVRWFRAADGRELLALFLHADRKRWVAWTPAGYYDTSPGGEDLIGWHFNRGRDAAADFFPASRLRDRFYRPDVVARILDTLDEAKAVKPGA
jgi:WD40 repeat protein